MTDRASIVCFDMGNASTLTFLLKDIMDGRRVVSVKHYNGDLSDIVTVVME